MLPSCLHRRMAHPWCLLHGAMMVLPRGHNASMWRSHRLPWCSHHGVSMESWRFQGASMVAMGVAVVLRWSPMGASVELPRNYGVFTECSYGALMVLPWKPGAPIVRAR